VHGKGICGVLYDEDKVSELDCLKGLGKLVYVKTLEDLNKVSAFFGSGPGYIYHMMNSYVRMMKEIGVGTTVEPDWRALTIDLFQGSIDLAQREPEAGFDELCSRVCSKGGTTERGVWAMEGLEQVYIKGASASIKRCGELTKDLGF
jgi:pyrroline-5-carboxylate reductase